MGDRPSYRDLPENTSMWKIFEALTERQQFAARLAAEGYLSQRKIAAQVEQETGQTCSQAYIWQLYNLPSHRKWREVVDWLTLKFGFGTPAGRLRYINKAISQYIDEDGNIATTKDALDWVKAARMEMEKFGTGKVEQWPEDQFDLKGMADDELEQMHEDIDAYLKKARVISE